MADLSELSKNDKNYWLSLNDTGRITEKILENSIKKIAFEREEITSVKHSLSHDGYFVTRPCIEQGILDELIVLIDGVMQAGHKPAYALVYDQFYEVFRSISDLLVNILGESFLIVPDEPDVFFIPTSDSCAGAEPHRDTIRYPNMYTEEGLPKIINVWIPLTDATELNSCMYVQPASLDYDYKTSRAMKKLPKMIPQSDLQRVRAIPAKAGSIVGWSTELKHWGGFSSKFAEYPRLSVAMYFQRGDCDIYHESAIDSAKTLPLEYRIYCIEKVDNDPDGKKLDYYLDRLT